MASIQQPNLRSFKDDRFINNSFSEFQEAKRIPIWGYQDLPLQSLEQATEKLISFVPGLGQHVTQAKEKCNRNDTILTWDESAAIYLYTMPTPFFSYLNKALRDENRQILKPWFAYLRLIIQALEKLPSLEMNVWRGITDDIGTYIHKNDDLIWWSVSSCSEDPKVVELYLGMKGTLFNIKSFNGKNISSFSAFPIECEVVLMPGTHLYVINDVLSCRDHFFTVELEEIQQSSFSNAYGNTTAQNPLKCHLTDDSEVVAQHITNDSSVLQQLLPPISGYDTMPLVSLEEAVQPLVSVLPVVQKIVHLVKKQCTNPADGLIPDESAAIMLYTMSWEPLDQCLYYVLNITLRSTNREHLQPWFLYLKLLLTALSKLPLITKRTIYRGIKLDFNKQYSKGDTIIWWGFTSCTTSIGVLNSELFLGKTGNRTMFAIETNSGIKISNHSKFKAEDEVLLLPARQFKIHDCLDQGGGLHVIQLQEIQPPTPLLQPVTREFIYSDGGRYIGNVKGGKRHGIGTYEYTNGEKYQGEWANNQTNGKGTRTFPSGNRYEGVEKDGKRHGYGIYYWANGEKYEGSWSNDKKHGSGKYIWPNNSQYEGTYKDDKKHGQGTLIFVSGRVKKGTWENDQFKG